MDYTSPPDLNPEADAIDLMLIDPPFNSNRGGSGGHASSGGGGGHVGGSGGGGGGGHIRDSTATDWKYTPAAQPQPTVCNESSR